MEPVAPEKDGELNTTPEANPATSANNASSPVSSPNDAPAPSSTVFVDPVQSPAIDDESSTESLAPRDATPVDASTTPPQASSEASMTSTATSSSDTPANSNESQGPAKINSNIFNSPNISTASVGPSEEELAEQKRREELAKLDESKPLVAEPLFDNGKSMERRKRRPLVIIFILLLLITVAGLAYAVFSGDINRSTKETPASQSFHYTEEVKVGVDPRLSLAFENVKSGIQDFDNITTTTLENNPLSYYENLRQGQSDLLITTKVPELIENVSATESTEPTEPSTSAEPSTLTKKPFLNDAIVAIVSKDAPVDSIMSDFAAGILAGAQKHWPVLEQSDAASDSDTSTQAEVDYEAPTTMRRSDSDDSADSGNIINVYRLKDELLDADLSEYVAGAPLAPAPEDASTDISKLVDAVSEDPTGVAFVRYSDLSADQTNTIKMLEIDNVAPDFDSISSTSYPFVIEYFIFSLTSLETDSTAAYYQENLTANASNVGIMPVPRSN